MSGRHLYPSRALHAQVAHEIGRRIAAGEFAEGTYLPREAQFARDFAVSRQAIREALKVLAAKGLVASRRRTGTRVLERSEWNLLDPDVLAWHPADQLPTKFMDDLVDLRRIIEPAAAALAAVRRTPDSLAEIRDALEQMEAAADDADAFNAADTAFHAAVFAASGNDLIDRLRPILRPPLAAGPAPVSNLRPPHDEKGGLHRRVYEAIRDGSPDRARISMVHILDAAGGEATRVMRSAVR